jgi:hypothetical protein
VTVSLEPADSRRRHRGVLVVLDVPEPNLVAEGRAREVRLIRTPASRRLRCF